MEQVANYGLKDGKVFDFVKRETPSYSRDQGLLKELFRDIGVGPTIPGVGGAGKGPGQSPAGMRPYSCGAALSSGLYDQAVRDALDGKPLRRRYCA